MDIVTFKDKAMIKASLIEEILDKIHRSIFIREDSDSEKICEEGERVAYNTLTFEAFIADFYEHLGYIMNKFTNKIYEYICLPVDVDRKDNGIPCDDPRNESESLMTSNLTDASEVIKTIDVQLVRCYTALTGDEYERSENPYTSSSINSYTHHIIEELDILIDVCERIDDYINKDDNVVGCEAPCCGKKTSKK